MSKAKHHKDIIATLQVDETISLEEQIAQRAHELWMERGKHHGNDFNDWLRAERQVNEWHQRRLHLRQKASDELA
jgi:hypothetical protein